MKKVHALCAIFLAILFLTNIGFATRSILNNETNPPPDENISLRISEFFPNPAGSDATQEFIEIQNTGSQEILLTGICITDMQKEYCFPENQTLFPEEYFVYWRKDMSPKISLNNSGETLFLLDKEGNEIHQLGFSGSAEEAKTWSFSFDWCDPTPGEENCKNSELPPEDPVDPTEPPEDQDPDPIDSEIPFPESEEIQLSEIVSHPELGNEWVEIYFSGSEEKNISGFSLFDEVGQIFLFPENTILSPGDFFVAEGWGNKLNNTGDSVFLKNTNGETYGEVQFGSLEKGESWANIEGNWQSTDAITYGKANAKGTKKEEPPHNSPPSENPPILGEIYINEVVSDPTTGNEWVEFFSVALEERDISGFLLEDAVGTISFSLENSIISPGEFFIIEWESAKLNNSGDTLYFKNYAGEIYEKISIPKTGKGNSWARFEKGFEITGAVTKGAINQKKDPITSSKASSGKKKKIVSQKAPYQTVNARDIEIIISEVLFRSREKDYVELYCQKCDVDLGGLRVADDAVFFTFPEKTYVESGEYVLISFLPEDKRKKFIETHEDGVWNFVSTKKGLTATDETLFILDWLDVIEDGICIANQNGSFSSGEKEDVIHLVQQGKVYAQHPLEEKYCFDSRFLGNEISMVWSGKKTGSPVKDYFSSEKKTPGKVNQKPPKRAEDIHLQIIQEKIFPDGSLAVEIQNKGSVILFPDDFLLKYGENSLFTMGKKLSPNNKTTFLIEKYNGESVEIEDSWGERAKLSQKIRVENSRKKRNVDVQISEIFPNPKGADGEKEFVELQCVSERCNLEEYLFFIGNKKIPLPKKHLRSGEFLVINSVSLRNSDLSLLLFNLNTWEEQSQEIKKAEEGVAYIPLSLQGKSHFEYQIQKSIFPTPNQKNIPLTEEFGDADKDTIPNSFEYLLGSNPLHYHSPTSTPYEVFEKYISQNINLRIEESEEGLRISGESLPNSSLRIILDSETVALPVSSKKDGTFSKEIFPDLSPGEHDVDIIFSGYGRTIVMTDFIKVNITKNPQEDWLKNIQIAGILPNPEGSDSEKEVLIIKNLEKKSGYLKHAVLSTGTKKVALENIYIPADGKKIISAKMLPTLKNTGGKLEILDRNEKILDEISWEKAKSGQWFGEAVVERNFSKKKLSKKKTTKYRTPITLETEEWNPKIQILGKFLRIEKNMIVLRGFEKNERYFSLSETLSPLTLTRFIDIGDVIFITVQSGNVVEINFLHESMVDKEGNFYILQFFWWVCAYLGLGVFGFFLGIGFLKK